MLLPQSMWFQMQPLSCFCFFFPCSWMQRFYNISEGVYLSATVATLLIVNRMYYRNHKKNTKKNIYIYIFLMPHDFIFSCFTDIQTLVTHSVSNYFLGPLRMQTNFTDLLYKFYSEKWRTLQKKTYTLNPINTHNKIMCKTHLLSSEMYFKQILPLIRPWWSSARV